MTTMAIGKFEVLGSLGQGAGSAILKIRRKADGKVYALKVVPVSSADDLKYVEQVKHEYEVAAPLNHPNLVKIYALEVSKNLLFQVTGARLLLEYIDGLPLSECPQLPLLSLLKVLVKVADGLVYLHERGIYHADIKPENIMVTGGGVVKIIDFGLAWRRGQQKHRVQGTLDFLAPEQIRKKTANTRTDIFNFGATMYRVLAGKPIPLQFREKGASRLGRVDDLIQPAIEVNPDVPEDLDELIRQCVRFRPDERPKTMKEVQHRLVRIGKRLRAEAKKNRPGE